MKFVDYDFLGKMKYKDGIWYANSGSQISYPDEGNEVYFDIEENSFWFSYRNKCIKLLLNRFKNDGVFLDIGGGNGFVTRIIQEKSPNNVFLVEPGLRGCLNAKNRGVKNIVCASFEDLDCEDNSIDNIGLFDVLEHIKNDSEFLRKLGSKMSGSSKLFITVPAFQHLWSVDDLEAGHFRRYTKKQITKILEDNQFRVKYANYYFNVLYLPILLFRRLPSLLKIRKDSLSRARKDHGDKGILSRVISKFLQREFNRLTRGKQNWFGSSLIVVAEYKIKK